MRNKLLISVLCAVMLLGTIAGAVTVGYAWLSPGKTVSVAADGTAIASYFAGGTGTEDDPYILKTPQHVYNLAWLQYMGVFNVTDANGNLEDQYFFRLDSDINMEGSIYQIIPPIGTIQNPFVGHFDGLGSDGVVHTISNAIVANYIESTSANKITEHPPSVDEVRHAEIIGFFGIIGTYEEIDGTSPLGYNASKPLILTSTGDDSQLARVGVENLILDNVTVVTEPHTVSDGEMYSLLGLFAGFVNGTIKNIKVTSGTIAVNQGVDEYYANLVDPSITRDEAGNVIATPPFSLNITRSVSKYTLIGDYMYTRIDWTGGPLTGPTTDSGTNAGFGGSIDMLTLAKRITYMFGAGYEASPDSSVYYVPTEAVRNNNHINAYTFATKTVFNYESSSDQVLSLRHGTYLPLNVNLESINQSNYTTSSKEDIQDGNTGYIVGKYKVGYNRQPLSLNRRIIGQLCHSMQGGSTSEGAWKNLQYTDAVDKQLQILTVGTDGNFYVIGDTYNNLQSTDDPYEIYKNAGITVQRYNSDVLNLTQYDDSTSNQVRRKVGELLKQSEMMFGIKFATLAPNITSDTDATRDGLLHLAAGAEVMLGDKTVNSLVQDSIHFALKNQGVITMVMATPSSNFNYIVGEKNGSQTVYPSIYAMPMLYRVERNGDGDITNLEAIRTICRDNVTGEISYNDTLTNNNAPSGKTLLYNYDTMGKLCTGSNTSAKDAACMQSLFYFEIPVDKGEFVLGGGGATNAQSFLVYLDIGANAGTEGTEGDGEDGGNKPDYDGEISGVYFVDASGNNITQDGKTDGPAVAFDIKNDASNGGGSITFSGTSSGVTQSNVKGSMIVEAVIKENDPADSGGSG